MQARKALATLLLAALTGCGGGFVSIGVGTFFDDKTFIIWSGNDSSDRVVDANNHAFAFYTDSGCLYNFQTQRENSNFCLTTTGNTAQYGGLLVRITNIRAVTGVCITAMVDAATTRFIDIELDASGREIVSVTALQPQFCVV